MNRAGDIVLLALASSAVALRDGVFHGQEALILTFLSVAVWLVASRALHQYDPDNGREFFDDLALTLVMVSVAALPVATLSLVSPVHVVTDNTSRFLVVLLPTVLLLRIRQVGFALWRAESTIDVLIAGTGPLGRFTAQEIADSDPSRRILGYLRFDDETTDHLGGRLLGNVANLEQELRARVVGEVYFASTETGHGADMQAGIRTCEKLGVPFALPACAYRLTRAKITNPPSDGYLHFLTVQAKPLERALKRAFDILSSGVALVLLSPLLLAVAICVKLTSTGPVLFRQERVGPYGRRFNMLKFRSMVANAEALKAQLLTLNEQSGPVFKMQRDPRVTGVGRFIRKYSIDELPQLVNVLRGDMSVVGPRPPLPSEVAKYEGWQYRRLSVRGGLTCVWQVSGRNAISFEQWMLLDLGYIDHWGLLYDFGLILRTIPVVLLGRGAS